MNELKATFDFPLDPQGEERGSPLFLSFGLRIDGLALSVALDVDKVYETPVDIEGFAKSAEDTGLHRLLVCSCGDPGCDSAYVECEVGERAIRWTAILGHDEMGEPNGVLKECSMGIGQSRPFLAR